MTRRAHVVPAGYQRNFARGELIRVVEKTTFVEREIPVRHSFVEPHFLREYHDGVASDPAERAFAEAEARFLPAIRGITLEGGLDPSAQLAICQVAAMLFARSFATERVSVQVSTDVLERHLRAAPESDLYRAVWAQEHGRDPDDGEIENIVREQAAKLRRDRWPAIERMLRHHDYALDKFLGLHVTLYGAYPGTEFVTSDNPLLIADSNELRQVGVHRGLALNDAGLIVLPLTRWVAASFNTVGEPNMTLGRPEMLRINQAMWRNAVERIALHPAVTDWAALCNVRRLDS